MQLGNNEKVFWNRRNISWISFVSKCYVLLFTFMITKIYLTVNKNTLTGPANCKKTTRHHAHLSCAKSRKTDDAKSRKWPKTSIWAIFWRFRGQISPNCIFFWKIGFIQIVRAIFEKNIEVFNFGLIWRPFCEYLQIKNFFQKSGSVTFLPL